MELLPLVAMAAVWYLLMCINASIFEGLTLVSEIRESGGVTSKPIPPEVGFHPFPITGKVNIKGGLLRIWPFWEHRLCCHSYL